MKNSIIKSLLVWVFVNFNALNCFCQLTPISNFQNNFYHSYIFNPKNLLMPSPEAYKFSIYGNVGVDKYNGLLDLGVNLYTYQDIDFKIPISLKYISSGFKPNERPTSVGVNWMLNCGGIITRKVMGRPDDTKGSQSIGDYSLDYYDTGIFYAKKMAGNDPSKFHYNTKQNLWDFNVIMSDENLGTFHNVGYFEYDLQPDIFRFTFADCSGSFMINSNGEPQLLDNNNCKIIIDEMAAQDLQSGTFPKSSKISIVNDKGLIYTFGGDASCLEYSIPTPKVNYSSPPRHITAWYLSSIKAPNGRLVSFQYHNSMQRQKYWFLGYSQSFTDYKLTTEDHLFYDYWEESEDYTYFSLYKEPSSIESHFSDATIFEDQNYKPVLDNITIGESKISFVYDQTAVGFYDINQVDDKSIILDSINIKDGFNLIHNIGFSYLPKNEYFFLQSIDNNGEVYGLHYNLDIDLPKPLVLSVDHWGFWKGGYETEFSEEEDEEEEEVLNYFNNTETNKSTNPDVVDVGLIEDITYPTGGLTKFKFECNRYKQYYDITTVSKELSLQQSQSPTLPNCGGARVFSISDYDNITGKDINIRKYYYKNQINGTENGVLNHYPRYSTVDKFDDSGFDQLYSERDFYNTFLINQLGWEDYFWYDLWEGPPYVKFDYTSSQMNIDYSSNFLGANSPFTEYHISYPNVIETFEENGSYNIYSYTSKIDIPDVYENHINLNSGMYFTPNDGDMLTAYNHGFFMQNDLSHFRGKLKSIETFDNTNPTLPVSSSVYSYNSSVKTDNWEVAINSKLRGACAYKYYTTPCLLMEETQKDKNGVETIIENKYNNRGLVSEKTTTNSNGNIASIVYRYPTDYQGAETDDNHVALRDLVSRNIIAEPTEIAQNSIVDGVAKTFDARLNKYKIFPNIGLPLKKSVCKLESNILPEPFSTEYYSNFSEKYKLTDYDINGNPSGLEESGGIKTAYVWGYDNKYLIAKIENAKPVKLFYDTLSCANLIISGSVTMSGSIVLPKTTKIKLNRVYENFTNTYTHFEIRIYNAQQSLVYETSDYVTFLTKSQMNIITLPEGTYTVKVYTNSSLLFNISLTNVVVNLTTIPVENFSCPYYTSFEEDDVNVSELYWKTGRKCHTGTYDLFLPIFGTSETPYILSFWGKVSASSSWVYVEQEITSNSNTIRTIGQGYAYIDEVRVYPKGALMTTYTYTPLRGMSSQTNPNNITTFYEYDTKGRLEYIKDNDKNILKKYSYHFSNQQ